MFIDTHAHIGCKDFKDSVKDVLNRAKIANVGAIINVSCAEDEQVDNIKWTATHFTPELPIYNTLGYHPDTFSNEDEENAHEHVEKLLKALEINFHNHKEKIVAIGECGLDYYRTFHRDAQIALFEGHVAFAAKVNKPLIIHLRGDVFEDFFKILEKTQEMKGVIHCFGGTMEQAKKVLEFPNMMMSFTGVITFKNAVESYKEILSVVPLERVMIETDSPYLAPVPYRGKQNEPAYVVDVAKQIAENKEVSLGEIERVTTENARRFFGI
ncbi:MAG: TatD family hydrolase [Candidatus Gracilibacteria bacterium]